MANEEQVNGELVAEEDAPAKRAHPDLDAGESPEWGVAALAEGMLPPAGRQVVFLAFKSEWTHAPTEGVPVKWRVPVPGSDPVQFVDEEHLSHVLVCWALTDGEERLALKRSTDDTRTQTELTKAFIRAHNGRRADNTSSWTKNKETMVSVDEVWSKIGPKCRQAVHMAYRRLHTLSGKEMADFFSQGFVVASSMAG